MREWYNYGRAPSGRANEYRIILEENGIPLILYSAYYNSRRGTYRLYPHTVFTPGDYQFEPFTLSVYDVRERKREKKKSP